MPVTKPRKEVENEFMICLQRMRAAVRHPIASQQLVDRSWILGRQTIFESSNQNIGWDGSYKGKQQPMGGYIYQCSYKFNGGVQKMVKGYFILIR